MNDETNPNWERICQVLEYSGEPSVNALAKKLGLKRAENLYQIKRGKNAVSMELARRINKAYPYFSISWLLCGESATDRMVSTQRYDIKKPAHLPYFENITEEQLKAKKSEKHIILSTELTHGADLALLNKDDALAPTVPQGSVLLVKEGSGEIMYGKTYLICTSSNTMLRIVRKGEGGALRLTSTKPESYDDIELNPEEIHSMYLVCAIISAHTL